LKISTGENSFLLKILPTGEKLKSPKTEVI